MLTTVRHIFGRIMHSETALHSQWDKGRKNNLLFASPSIRRPTLNRMVAIIILLIFHEPAHHPLMLFYKRENDTLIQISLVKLICRICKSMQLVPPYRRPLLALFLIFAFLFIISPSIA